MPGGDGSRKFAPGVQKLVQWKWLEVEKHGYINIFYYPMGGSSEKQWTVKQKQEKKEEPEELLEEWRNEDEK